MASEAANSSTAVVPAPLPTVMVRPAVVMLPSAELVGLEPWAVPEAAATTTRPALMAMLPVKLFEPLEIVSVPAPALVRPIEPERTAPEAMELASELVMVTAAFELTEPVLEKLTAPPVRLTGVERQPEEAGPLPLIVMVPVPALAEKLVGIYQTFTRPSEMLRSMLPLAALVLSARLPPSAACLPTSPDSEIEVAVRVFEAPMSSMPCG